MSASREVLVAIPVLGRPQNAQQVIQSLELSDPNCLCRPLFICTPGDTRQIAACHATGADVLLTDYPAGRGNFARKINDAYRATSEPFLFQAADDVEFREGWAEQVLYQIDRDGGYGICGTNDMANPLVMQGRHSTHTLFRREYVYECGASWDGPGTVFSERYSHQWTDTEAVELAKLRGCWTFAAAAHVLHHHPMYDRSVAQDDTYRKALADSAEDARLFHARQAEWLRVLMAA